MAGIGAADRDHQRPPVKVLIADDHPMVRDALKRTLLTLAPSAQMVKAQNLDEVRAGLADEPDLLLIDIHMPGMGGVDGLRRLCEAHPAQRVIVASGDDDPLTIRFVLALALGVAGFMHKSDSADVLMQALNAVLACGTDRPACNTALAIDSRTAAPTDASGLTPRQLQVLALLMQGQPNKLIARAMGLTEGTVKLHIAAILRALQARNRTEAVVVARKLGLGGGRRYAARDMAATAAAGQYDAD